ncbi:MATH and LRR domain-containing protein PFE0570w-like isoform X2 [Leptopilina boulardi]|uniref:MATH and LRR domain-containing protein PFE0570w-like isoform X2 n=1 Tax=Leptopilina boulardi TaxID=63433 RepID=UPI0021F5F21C|nr:MATH and LRR domain-containing protein PFE0570w-like isoform X2 [Leptopilina boulardi]
MNETIFTRVKINMKSKYFTFNESWLRECVQYCLKTHPKIPIEEIQSFAIEQWLLGDLREINNENGCLPKNLSAEKSTILNDCYILQDTLLPGNKLKIIGPITCRRGIILLEKKNIVILGGEVEDLLIVNSVENVLARFLNWQENPDPYNDVKKEKECEKMELEEEYLNDLVQLVRSQDSKDKEISNSLQNISTINRQSVSKLNYEKNLISQDKYSFDDELETLLNDPDLLHEFPSMTNENFPIPNETCKINPQILKLENLSNNRQCENNSLSITKIYKNNISELKNQNFEEKNSNSVNLLKSWNIEESKIFQNAKTKNEEEKNVKFIENEKIKNLPNSPISNDLILNDNDVIVIDDDSNTSEYSKFSKLNYRQNDNNLINIDFDLEIQKFKISSNKEEKLTKKTFDINNLNKTYEIDDKSSSNDSIKNKTSIDSIENDKYKISQNENKLFDEFSQNKSNTIKRPKSLGFKGFLNNKTSDIDEKKISKPFKPLFPKFNSKIKNLDMEIKNTNSELFSNEQINLETITKESSKNDNTKISNHNLDMRLNKLLNLPSDMEKSPTGSKRLASVDNLLNSRENKTPRVSESEGIFEIEEKMEITNSEEYPKNCDLICDLIVMTLTDQVLYKTIKAQVKEIVKLTNKCGVYKLTGVITDGTATLKVKFSSQFIEKIIGISALKFSTLKKQAKTDPNLEHKLLHSLRKGQEKLVKTDWLMHLALVKNEKPIVMEGFELSESEKEIFQKRLQILKTRQI